MDKIAHEVRAQEWFSIIQACNSSGLPKKQWCEENGIPVRKFFYWQKRIRAGLYKEAKEKDAGLVPEFRPGVKFCVSDFRQESRMALESRADSGLNPLITESHGGQNGMRAGTA